jgi:hypothetical protein
MLTLFFGTMAILGGPLVAQADNSTCTALVPGLRTFLFPGKFDFINLKLIETNDLRE